MIKRRLRAFFLASLLFVSQAQAGNLPEVIAYDAAMEAVAQVFSSPALPSLANDGTSISPIYGTVKIAGQDESYTSSATGASYDVHNVGEIKGEVAGLSFNYSGKGDLGFFATAAGSRVNGDLKVTSPNVTHDIRDISAQNTIGLLGLSYRAVGDAKSFFALGFFGGPAFVSGKTSSRFVYANGTSTKVNLDADSNAIYIGMQMMFRMGNFRLNPYLNILSNTSLGCYKPTYEGAPYVAAEYNTCSSGEPGVRALAFLAGTGINVGYGRFSFGLYSVGAGTNGAFKTTPLVFSLRIGL